MKKQKWMKWEPTKNIPQVLLLNSLTYDCNNLIIELYIPDEKSKILTIDFDGFLAFRSMDESKYSCEPREFEKTLLDMQPEPNFYQKWSLFTIKNSKYIDWFLEQTGGVHDNDPIIHYSIETPDDVIEVLDIKTENSPIVKWN